ncbi:AraC family transcriptional regulator [Streptomyces sp. XM4193]|uniref:helix-turn-helix transcriptional regulator n=1 Tax=Streptomyces sp. XM4193 TaxID=2929782 RepID=UPI001FF825B6|nr:AraC family transcriptional regulator [Streptomyces sp. XM4193]MCK1798068.1 AraC family transcriptional regulator [Streptomyces sp. XM4193]
MRTLPALAPGSTEPQFGIHGYDELVERDTQWGAHSHAFHELLWNERGASTAVIGTRAWTITPAVGLWMPAGTLHTGAAVAGTWLRAAFFGFRDTPPISDTPVAVEMTPLLRLLLKRLGEEQLSAHSRAVTEAMVLDVLTPSPSELLVHIPQSAVLRPIVEAVRTHPGDPRTLADWAQELDVSPRTITRAFTTETGAGFARWVATVRAQRAVELLVGGQEADEVAGQVGYRSTSAFGAAFRRTTGRTPGAFRTP